MLHARFSPQPGRSDLSACFILPSLTNFSAYFWAALFKSSDNFYEGSKRHYWYPSQSHYPRKFEARTHFVTDKVSVNSPLALMVAYLYGVPLIGYALSIQLAVLLLSGCLIFITHKYVLSTKKLTYYCSESWIGERKDKEALNLNDIFASFQV